MASEQPGSLDPFEHVVDTTSFHLPFHWHLDLPQIPFLPSIDKSIEAGHLIFGFQITKFMVLQLLAGLLLLVVFLPLMKRVQRGEAVTGRFWNFWEMICIFIRDEVVRPTIGDPHVHHDDFGSKDHADPGMHAKGQYDPGHHDPLKETLDVYNHKVYAEEPVAELGGHPADKYLPIVWTLFFWILFNNLFGAIPWMGAATGSISVTSVLALFVFGVVVYAGSQASGAVGFWKSLLPHMDLPGPIGLLLKPMIWAIEFFGLLIKHLVLAVRLFANMMAGHTVLGVMLGFIGMAAAAHWSIFGVVTAGSVAGQLFIGLLELFVAFLQAYVFAFLATLFISAAVHPH